ncbi:PilZ domain-containing protein [Desulfosarcina sp. OttesenSCG-928-B08]|nr:PilZ domain-containing protein [Desulfosarcina sp. OttesenSCG-928-B08]
MKEKRMHTRADSVCLLNYVFVDEDAAQSIQGMGRTINVSESGIMLEVHEPFQENNTIDVAIGLMEDIVPIRGKVVFTNPTHTGKYHSGIKFLVVEPPARETLRHYILEFNAASAEADTDQISYF